MPAERAGGGLDRGIASCRLLVAPASALHPALLLFHQLPHISPTAPAAAAPAPPPHADDAIAGTGLARSWKSSSGGGGGGVREREPGFVVSHTHRDRRAAQGGPSSLV